MAWRRKWLNGNNETAGSGMAISSKQRKRQQASASNGHGVSAAAGDIRRNINERGEQKNQASAAAKAKIGAAKAGEIMKKLAASKASVAAA